MGKRVIKFEFEDEDGGKYLFKLEGEITRDKILKLLDIYELMSLKIEKNKEDKTPSSLQDKILSLIEDEFLFKKFTSKELQEMYEDKFNEPIKLSVISTYLRRFTDSGILYRIKDGGREWKYMVKIQQNQILKRR